MTDISSQTLHLVAKELGCHLGQVVLNVFVLAGFDGTVGWMNSALPVFHVDGIDSQNRVLIALRLHNVANGHGSHVGAVLEVPGINRRLPNFVEDFTGVFRGRKKRTRLGGHCATQVFVLDVFLGAANNAIAHDIADRLRHFGDWRRNVDDEPDPVLRDIFFACSQWDRCQDEDEKKQERPIAREIPRAMEIPRALGVQNFALKLLRHKYDGLQRIS